MKTIAGLLIVFVIGLSSLMLYQEVIGRYHFEREYLQHWNLADKSSTIPAKQKHIKDFVDALEQGNLVGQFASHNAIFLQTPNNDFRANITALQTLNERLTEIQGMDVNSFQYNTAIQQITAQEQGEADEMLNVISGCYFLASYPLVWNWLLLVNMMVIIFAGIAGIGVFVALRGRNPIYERT